MKPYNNKFLSHIILFCQLQSIPNYKSRVALYCDKYCFYKQLLHGQFIIINWASIFSKDKKKKNKVCPLICESYSLLRRPIKFAILCAFTISSTILMRQLFHSIYTLFFLHSSHSSHRRLSLIIFSTCNKSFLFFSECLVLLH